MKEQEESKDPEDAMSSGLSSDNDADLIIEQDIISQKRKHKKVAAQKPSEVNLDKDQAMKVWDLAIKDCPEDYTF